MFAVRYCTHVEELESTLNRLEQEGFLIEEIQAHVMPATPHFLPYPGAVHYTVLAHKEDRTARHAQGGLLP